MNFIIVSSIFKYQFVITHKKDAQGQMTPRRIKETFDKVHELMNNKNHNHFLWAKINQIKRFIFEEQELEKGLQMIEAYKRNPFLTENKVNTSGHIFIFISLMECVCRYKLGQFENFRETLDSLKIKTNEVKRQQYLQASSQEHFDYDLMDQADKNNLEFIKIQNRELGELINKYQQAIEDIIEFERNMDSLGDLELFRYASLVSNFSKGKALYALCVILKRNPKWENDKAFKAGTNLLHSIENVEERRPLLEMFNKSLSKRKEL